MDVPGSVFPTKHEALITASIIAFCGGTIFGLSVRLDVGPLLSALATLLAAFLGAFFAYKLNEAREKSREISRQVDAGNLTLAKVIRAFNLLGNYKKQFIDPAADSPAIHYAILPSSSLPDWKFGVDYDSLSFMFGKGMSLRFSEITELDELVHSSLESIRTRSQFHAEQVQPALEKAGVKQGMEITLKELDDILGPRNLETLKGLTEGIIYSVEKGVELSEKLVTDLHRDLKEAFPGHAVISMQRKDVL